MKKLSTFAFLLLFSGCNLVSPDAKTCYTCTKGTTYTDPTGRLKSIPATKEEFEVCGDADLKKNQGKAEQSTVNMGGITVNTQSLTNCRSK